ncbi:hypothetical protein HDV00_009853 [Rhizophlyctis rosea]|nr:hypothetical protein HDV00_009853 [Rhizophlyctis rosea]
MQGARVVEMQRTHNPGEIGHPERLPSFSQLGSGNLDLSLSFHSIAKPPLPQTSTAIFLVESEVEQEADDGWEDSGSEGNDDHIPPRIDSMDETINMHPQPAPTSGTSRGVTSLTYFMAPKPSPQLTAEPKSIYGSSDEPSSKLPRPMSGNHMPIPMPKKKVAARLQSHVRKVLIPVRAAKGLVTPQAPAARRRTTQRSAKNVSSSANQSSRPLPFKLGLALRPSPKRRQSGDVVAVPERTDSLDEFGDSGILPHGSNSGHVAFDESTALTSGNTVKTTADRTITVGTVMSLQPGTFGRVVTWAERGDLRVRNAPARKGSDSDGDSWVDMEESETNSNMNTLATTVTESSDTWTNQPVEQKEEEEDYIPSISTPKRPLALRLQSKVRRAKSKVRRVVLLNRAVGAFGGKHGSEERGDADPQFGGKGVNMPSHVPRVSPERSSPPRALQPSPSRSDVSHIGPPTTPTDPSSWAIPQRSASRHAQGLIIGYSPNQQKALGISPINLARLKNSSTSSLSSTFGTPADLPPNVPPVPPLPDFAQSVSTLDRAPPISPFPERPISPFPERPRGSSVSMTSDPSSVSDKSSIKDVSSSSGPHPTTVTAVTPTNWSTPPIPPSVQSNIGASEATPHAEVQSPLPASSPPASTGMADPNPNGSEVAPRSASLQQPSPVLNAHQSTQIAENSPAPLSPLRLDSLPDAVAAANPPNPTHSSPISPTSPVRVPPTNPVDSPKTPTSPSQFTSPQLFAYPIPQSPQTPQSPKAASERSMSVASSTEAAPRTPSDTQDLLNRISAALARNRNSMVASSPTSPSPASSPTISPVTFVPEPIQPVQPIAPVQSAQPVQFTKPIPAMQPVQSTQPVYPTQPVQPAQPIRFPQLPPQQAQVIPPDAAPLTYRYTRYTRSSTSPALTNPYPLPPQPASKVTSPPPPTSAYAPSPRTDSHQMAHDVPPASRYVQETTHWDRVRAAHAAGGMAGVTVAVAAPRPSQEDEDGFKVLRVQKGYVPAVEEERGGGKKGGWFSLGRKK